MKNALKQAAGFLIGISLLLNLCVPLLAAGEPVVTLTLNKATVARGGEIAVTVNVDPATTKGGNFDIEYPNLEYVRWEETDGVEKIDLGQPTSTASDVIHPIVSPASDRVVTQLGTYYFRVPETAELGTHHISVSSINIYYDKLNPTYDEWTTPTCTPVSFTVVEQEPEAETPQGWTAALSGPDTAACGVEITYSIEVTSDSFSAAQLELTYDRSYLTPTDDNADWSFDSGKAKLVQYGQTPTMPHTYTLKMKTAGIEGSATLTLTSAAFGTSESAVEHDLTAATITGSSVTTAIHKSSYSVRFQADDISHTGNATASYGGDYSFEITDVNREYYTYTVSATMGGKGAEATPGEDGSYTISRVTGDLVITITRIPKTYQVTFEKASDSMNITLPGAQTATYGTDYTCTLPTESGYTLGASVKINGSDYTEFSLENGTLTIPGADIKGEIVITIRRTAVPVSVKGSGAADARDYAKTATVGQSYTLTVTQDSNYDYTVTATMGGNAITVTHGNSGSYTIQKVTDAGELVFTVNKSVKTNDTDVSEYVKCNGTACWLVVKKCEKLTTGVYAYQGQPMFWSEQYSGYCILVIGANKPVIDASELSIISGKPTEIDYTGDVNKSGKVDANDAQLIYDLYTAHYGDFNKVTMEKFLRADVNGDTKINVNDAAAVVDLIRSK